MVTQQLVRVVPRSQMQDVPQQQPLMELPEDRKRIVADFVNAIAPRIRYVLAQSHNPEYRFEPSVLLQSGTREIRWIENLVNKFHYSTADEDMKEPSPPGQPSGVDINSDIAKLRSHIERAWLLLDFIMLTDPKCTMEVMFFFVNGRLRGFRFIANGRMHR